MANVINKLTVGSISYNLASTAYATCATAASTVAKAAYIDGTSATSGFSLVTGTTVHVKFTYANKVSNPTLSINGSTAKSIKRYDTTSPGVTPETSWNAGEVVSFTYDGSYWQMNKNPAELASLITRINTLETAIQDYINNGGSGSNPSNPDIDVGVDTVTCSTIAAIKDLDSSTAFQYTGTCWIVYKSGNYTLLQDATGYITVYNSMSSYSVSTKLSTFTGTASLYQGTIQVNNIANITTSGSVSTVTPVTIEHIDDFSLVPGYYKLQDKSFSLYNDGTYDWWRCTDDYCIWIRDDCSSHPTSETDTYTFDLVIFAGYNGTPPPFKIAPNGSNGVLLNLTGSDGESPGSGGDTPDTPDTPDYPDEGTVELDGNGDGMQAVSEEISAGWYEDFSIGPGLMLNNNSDGYTSFEAEQGVAIYSIRIGLGAITPEDEMIIYTAHPVICTSDGQRFEMYWDEETGGWYWEGYGIGIIGNFWIQWEDSSGNIGDYHPDPIFIEYGYTSY